MFEGLSWKQLYADFLKAWDGALRLRTDPERAEAQFSCVATTMLAMLEKLRDQEESDDQWRAARGAAGSETKEREG